MFPLLFGNNEDAKVGPEGQADFREYNCKGVLPLTRVSLWEVLILAKNVENILLFNYEIYFLVFFYVPEK